MAAAGNGGKEGRKKNYSKEEKSIIIAGIVEYDKYLHGPLSHKTRKEILRELSLQVSAVGNVTRTPEDIQKKINDLRRKVREKLAAIRKHARGTGGGPASYLRLMDEEEIIAECFQREQVEGMEGFDSGDQSLRSGKCV